MPAGFYLKTGEPTVIYDPAFIARFSPPMRDFTFFHECGHLALGHALRILNGEPYEMWMEDQADTFAMIEMVRLGYATHAIVEVHAEVRKFRADAQHRGGRHRDYGTRIGRCFGYITNWLAGRPSIPSGELSSLSRAFVESLRIISSRTAE